MCPHFIAGKQRLCLLCDVQSQLQRVLSMPITLHLHCWLVALLRFALKESMLYIHVSDLCHRSECNHGLLHMSAQITKIRDHSTTEMLTALKLWSRGEV